MTVKSVQTNIYTWIRSALSHGEARKGRPALQPTPANETPPLPSSLRLRGETSWLWLDFLPLRENRFPGSSPDSSDPVRLFSPALMYRRVSRRRGLHDSINRLLKLIVVIIDSALGVRCGDFYFLFLRGMLECFIVFRHQMETFAYCKTQSS